jgi:hypothetical protein
MDKGLPRILHRPWFSMKHGKASSCAASHRKRQNEAVAPQPPCFVYSLGTARGSKHLAHVQRAQEFERLQKLTDFAIGSPKRTARASGAAWAAALREVKRLPRRLLAKRRSEATRYRFPRSPRRPGLALLARELGEVSHLLEAHTTLLI